MKIPFILAAGPHEAARLTLLVALILALGVLALTPAFWRVVWGPSKTTDAPGAAPMSRGRILLAYGVILFIAGGSIAALILDHEYWPWSNFPMYSTDLKLNGNPPVFDDYRIYGVCADDPAKEIDLYTDGRYLQPFDPSRLANALDNITEYPDRVLSARLTTGLRDCLMRYEAGRAAGHHNGPALSAVKLYRVYYTLDPTGSNIDKPDKLVFVQEVSFKG